METEAGIDDWDPVEYLRKKVPQAQYNRRSFDRTFYRNILFFVGLQWLRYSRSQQQWRPISLPDWFPKSLTNIYAVCVEDMKSVFMQSDPVSIFSPEDSESPADVAAARAAEDISKLIEQEEVGQSELEAQLAAWIVLTGNGFIEDGYDNDPKHGTKFLPDYMCLQCVRHIPAQEASDGCPLCGGVTLMEARDENGEAIGSDVPVGKMYSEVCSPFEIHFDLVAGSTEKSPYVYRAKTYPIELLRDMFPEYKDSIKSDDAGVDSGMFYQTALAYITNGVASSPGNYGGSVGSIDNVPRATLYHLWVRPTEKLPKGGEALIVSNTCIWKSSLSYSNQAKKPFVPITQFGFNRVPGRAFAKTPSDDLIYKQIQRNKLESFIQIYLERVSNGTWLLPKGIGIAEISGEPGEKIWYNAFGGSKPERLPGADMPGAVFRWLATLDADMKRISHTEDIMHGKAPEGVPTLGATQLLLERNFSGFADGLKSWGCGWNNVRKNRLLIWREFVDEARTMTVLGKNREWESKKFSKDDIQGRINVHLEEASIAPKSKAYQQLVTGQLLQQTPGLIDLSDPSVRVAVLNLYDASDLVGSIDIDMLDAEKEKEEFTKTGQPRPRPGVDSDPIHSSEHKKTAKSDDFKHWPPQLQQAWLQHIAYHDQRVAQQQQTAQENDPHILNAKAKLLQIQAELEGDQKAKGIELQHLLARKQIDLHAHGVKKGMDAIIDAKKAAIQNGALTK